GHGDGIVLDVDSHLQEVPLHGDPRAARGDPHRLVVVAVRPAAGESVAKPEIVVERDPLGDVGQGRGALVGGDDEIGIVVVPDHDLFGVNDLVVDDIVGDRQAGAAEN